jgi:DNA-binding PadR family transcriptional regulator
VILHFLKDKPSYGYEIIQGLEERFYGFYIPSPGMVYPTLQMFEEMGYVNVSEQDGKKVYTITNEGLEVLAKQGNLEEKIEHHTKNLFNPENIDDIGDTKHELEKLTQLINNKLRIVDTKKLMYIRKVISQTYEKISKIEP